MARQAVRLAPVAARAGQRRHSKDGYENEFKVFLEVSNLFFSDGRISASQSPGASNECYATG